MKVVALSLAILMTLMGTVCSVPMAFAEENKEEPKAAAESGASKIGEQQLGKEVCVTGVAQNAKLGPVVLVDQQAIYLKGSEWPLELLNQRVRVTGILRKFELPVATQKDGVYSAGVSEPGAAYRLEKVKWKRVGEGD